MYTGCTIFEDSAKQLLKKDSKWKNGRDHGCWKFFLTSNSDIFSIFVSAISTLYGSFPTRNFDGSKFYIKLTIFFSF